MPGDTFLTKMPAELPSTEQIFTETSRLVPPWLNWIFQDDTLLTLNG